ncbi:hypothetical protein [Algoriphagus sp. AK58]|uniref:hypothetical protein n=1 Tax=Algoriphagus sp. AK58 TaxID=1406877 RepID=UPI00165066E3|nr:hypothetical protein [Algoriphagus sp. AK58]MBC6365676.1 hypothetical protein [Algoriphagus sp. AK58]
MNLNLLNFRRLLLFSPAILLFACSGSNENSSGLAENAQLVEINDPNVQADVLPFSLEFVEQTFSNEQPLPRLQSYVHVMGKSGELLILGGRKQGLHTFKSEGSNFVRDSSNHFMFVIDPSTGKQWSLDVNQLGDELSAPLSATNMQAYHDRASDQFYIAGGYGWKADGSNMITFPSMMAFKVEDMIKAIKSGASADQIKGLISIGKDERYAVTGGELFLLNGNFYLVFGQRFDGQYRAFGGSDFTQQYTEEIRIFTLKRNSLEILSYGSTKSSDAERPFHRRDGNLLEDIDPVTLNPRIAAMGGVFLPGIIGAYDYPIYISGPQNPEIKKDIRQRFSQYECPVISVVQEGDSLNSVFHTFFGGISAYYYFQTPAQKNVYDSVTVEHRNDGFPFIADISTFQVSSDGSYAEYILPKPIPGSRLLGASIRFIPNRALVDLGLAFENGIIRLSKVPNGEKILAGYIYGGIEAENPLPRAPNTGTFVSNSLFAVYLNPKPSGAIPAEKAKKAVFNYNQEHSSGD